MSTMLLDKNDELLVLRISVLLPSLACKVRLNPRVWNSSRTAVSLLMALVKTV
jgi:hypothetical protein